MADLSHFLGISVTLSRQLGCSSLSANTLWIFFGVPACLTATHVTCLLTLVASSICPRVVDSTVSEFCWPIPLAFLLDLLAKVMYDVKARLKGKP
jgi:hypothetical protein